MSGFKTIAIIVLLIAFGTLGYFYLRKSTPIIFTNDDKVWRDSVAVLHNNIKNLSTQNDSVQILIDTLYIHKNHVQKIYLPIYTRIDTADMYVLDSIIRSNFRFDSLLQQRRIKNNRS